MAKICGIILLCVISLFTSQAQTVDWRFGFEDTWSGIASLLNEDQSRQLLEKLEWLVTEQQAGGDININGTAGGWVGMQPLQISPINFDEADEEVRLLQDYGFSMLWNLRINAPWAKRDNPDCYDKGPISSCAPAAEHEDALYDYVYAIVERYDGDGVEDMGHETPDDPSDDLRIPIQFYLMTGEIEFAGASPPPEPGFGDEARNHFWTDNIPNLLRTHRIVYRAIKDADPSGFTKLVSSGGVFWDLYTDFPDWPATEGPTVQARLNGANNHNARYTESFERLKTMLRSFGDDSDGIECDYIGWHPHMAWREIDQAFAFIKQYGGDKPIYVDDMWCNIFILDREDAPGNTLFFKDAAAREGDFPNELVEDFGALHRGVNCNLIPGALDWYYARHSRHLLKSFVSAFGEGAERVSISGAWDFTPARKSMGGHIDILGTPNEDFYAKPGYYTYKLMVDKLHDFSAVTEISVSSDPRTRVYRFERPTRGPVLVLWSETGGAPPDLDYRIPNGETVTLAVPAEELRLTRVIELRDQSEADSEILEAPGEELTIQLGYSPIFLEAAASTGLAERQSTAAGSTYHVELLSDNPFRHGLTMQVRMQQAADLRLAVYNVLGGLEKILLDRRLAPGTHTAFWDGRNNQGRSVAPGTYFLRAEAGAEQQTRTVQRLQ